MNQTTTIFCLTEAIFSGIIFVFFFFKLIRSRLVGLVGGGLDSRDIMRCEYNTMNMGYNEIREFLGGHIEQNGMYLAPIVVGSS